MDSMQTLLSNDSRTEIEFVPVVQEEDDDLDDDPDMESDRLNSLTPLELGGKSKDRFKDRLSFALSVFNLMNVILGSGILGLAEVMENLGIALFFILLVGTALLAGYNINLLLHTSSVAGPKSYEEIAQSAFGIKGKVLTSVMIVLHCLGAMATYVLVVKNELPEVLKALINYKYVSGEEIPIYLNSTVLMFMVLMFIIVPLSTFKEIRFLGYSSALGMFCMFFFTITVIVKKFTIPCPIPLEDYVDLNGTSLLPDVFEIGKEQVCRPDYFTLNSKSVYALPTMLFAFMCHASMFSIYDELRQPSIGRMQKVANIAIFNIFTIYSCAATFGYLTFYNKVQSELLLSYSLCDPKDPMIIASRIMVIFCVTLSVPLIHYPARKTIVLTFFKNSYEFSWFRHIGVMILVLGVTTLFVLFVPNIRDIFGMSGAATSTPLLLVLPSMFFIKITGNSGKSDIRSQYAKRRIGAWVMSTIGVIIMISSVVLILVDWFD